MEVFDSIEQSDQTEKPQDFATTASILKMVDTLRLKKRMVS